MQIDCEIGFIVNNVGRDVLIIVEDHSLEEYAEWKKIIVLGKQNRVILLESFSIHVILFHPKSITTWKCTL